MPLKVWINWWSFILHANYAICQYSLNTEAFGMAKESNPASALFGPTSNQRARLLLIIAGNSNRFPLSLCSFRLGPPQPSAFSLPLFLPGSVAQAVLYARDFC